MVTNVVSSLQSTIEIGRDDFVRRISAYQSTSHTCPHLFVDVIQQVDEQRLVLWNHFAGHLTAGICLGNLAIIGTLFGKGPYFRARVVKMWRRLLPAVLANRLFGAPD